MGHDGKTMGLDGPGLASMAVGGLLLFAGIKGYSVLTAVKDIVQGKSGSVGQSINELTGGQAASGGDVGGLTSASGGAPQNAKPMYLFFRAHGLSPNGAAGVVGNIAGESGGDPESVGSGGNGLIGWTPPRPGIVTGNRQRDLQVQLGMVMSYISQNGSVSDINSNASSPAAAARYFCFHYERPADPVGDSPKREAAANAVAKMMGGK